MLCEVERLRVDRGGATVLALDRVRFEGPGPALVRGPNGAGKTTLLSILGAIERPDEGRVTVLGCPVHPAGESERLAFRRRAVLCDSVPFFFRGDALSNVAFGVDRARAREALERIGAADLAARDPASLSSGERRRIDFARALARDPALLLLDEPTAHLDDDGARWVIGMILAFTAAGRSVICSNHSDARLDAIAREVVELAPRRR